LQENVALKDKVGVEFSCTTEKLVLENAAPLLN
jgi:hypothetical protein